MHVRTARRLVGVLLLSAFLLPACSDDSGRQVTSGASGPATSDAWTALKPLPDGWQPNVTATSLDEPAVYLIGRHKLDDGGGGYEQVPDAVRVDLGKGKTSDLPKLPVADAITTGAAVSVGGSLFVVGLDCPAGGDPDSGGFSCRFDEATVRALRLEQGADRWEQLQLPAALKDFEAGPVAGIPTLTAIGSRSAKTLFFLLRPQPMAAAVTVLPLDVGSGTWSDGFSASVVQSCSDGEQLDVLSEASVTPFVNDELQSGALRLTTYGADGSQGTTDAQIPLAGLSAGDRKAIDPLTFQLLCVGSTHYIVASPGRAVYVWRLEDGASTWQVLPSPPGTGSVTAMATSTGLCVVRGADGLDVTGTVTCNSATGQEWVSAPDLTVEMAGGAPQFLVAAGDLVVHQLTATGGTETFQALRPRS